MSDANDTTAKYFARFEPMKDAVETGNIPRMAQQTKHTDGIERVRELRLAIGTLITKQLGLYLTSAKDDEDAAQREKVNAQYQVVIDLLSEEMHSRQADIIANATAEDTTYMESYELILSRAINFVRPYAQKSKAADFLMGELYYSYETYGKYLYLIFERIAKAREAEMKRQGWNYE
jgi:hypothetical protein